MITPGELTSIRGQATAEVTENAPPPAPGQLALTGALLAPAVARVTAAAGGQHDGQDARGAA